jgi:uncharacterized membrane protein YdjX (TVP38/TMEM64 family)
VSQALRLLSIAAIAAVLVLAGWLLPLREWTLALAGSMREAGAFGVALFFVAYIVSAVALVPGSLLTLAAGFAYGPILGLLIASPASVAAATAAFVLGRTLLRDWVRRRVGASPRARAVDRAVGREGFKLVFLLRLSPLVPFNLLNYALSLSGVTVGRYVLASFLGMLPATFLYVYLGSLAPVAAELAVAGEQVDGLRTALYVGGLAATVLVVWVATRAARRALAEELEVSS